MKSDSEVVLVSYTAYIQYTNHLVTNENNVFFLGMPFLYSSVWEEKYLDLTRKVDKIDYLEFRMVYRAYIRNIYMSIFHVQCVSEHPSLPVKVETF